MSYGIVNARVQSASAAEHAPRPRRRVASVLACPDHPRGPVSGQRRLSGATPTWMTGAKPVMTAELRRWPPFLQLLDQHRPAAGQRRAMAKAARRDRFEQNRNPIP